jgi:hypothetical protein
VADVIVTIFFCIAMEGGYMFGSAFGCNKKTECKNMKTGNQETDE